MKQEKILRHEFVEYIPSELKDGTIYVSIAFATAAHKCCCGCGNEVVTPISPTDWQLTFDGESISLDPSIGNWNFACQSHYWIRKNKVTWARRLSSQEIAAGRAHDRWSKEKQFDATQASRAHGKNAEGPKEGKDKGLWRNVKKRLF